MDPPSRGDEGHWLISRPELDREVRAAGIHAFEQGHDLYFMVSSHDDGHVEEGGLMSESVRDLVKEYVAAAGERRFDRLAELVHPEATFRGTVKGETRDGEAFVQGFRNVEPIIARNEVRELIVEGNRASVLYDFVTDTPVGPVVSAEFLTVEDGMIRSSTLLFDSRRWPEVVQELQARTARRPRHSRRRPDPDGHRGMARGSRCGSIPPAAREAMRTFRGMAPRLLATVVAGLSLLAACGRSHEAHPTIDGARSELRGYIEDVTQATASRYAVVDDRGHEMDTVKIIAVPESGGFVGLYHSFREDSGTFAVHLATSADLMNWTWRRELAEDASMPTIKPASDGGYVVAWEQEPPNHVRLTYYRSWRDLLAGAASKSFDAPLRLSSCAEGTPNLYAASSSRVDVGFHFYRDCELDRQAWGTTDWHSWTASARPTLDAALEARGVMGGIGDRDVIRFRGFDLTLIEGQVVQDDWRTWRVFLYDNETGDAQQLDLRTHAGSIAFANPTITAIEIGGRNAILVALFIPGEGARGAEAGELIYYRTYGPGAPDQ